jgi:hypothetical protein
MHKLAGQTQAPGRIVTSAGGFTVGRAQHPEFLRSASLGLLLITRRSDFTISSSPGAEQGHVR